MATLTSYTGVRFSPRSYCPDYIGFFGKQSVFSNFHPSPIHYKTLQLHDDPNKLQQEMVVDFKTAEAMFQWKKAMSNPVANACYPTPKAVDGDVCYAIRTAATPSRAKQLGRKVELDPLTYYFHLWCLNSNSNLNPITSKSVNLCISTQAVYPNG